MLISAPTRVRDKTTGLLLVYTHGDESRLAEDVRLLSIAATSAALALDVARRDVREEFLAMLRHDINNPVSVAIGYTEMLVEACRDRGMKELLDIALSIEESLEVVADLVSNYLHARDRRRLAAPRVPSARPRRADDDQVADRYRLYAAQKGITIECTGRSPLLLADRRPLTRVLGNLLSNAIKYTKGPGRVTLACAATTRTARSRSPTTATASRRTTWRACSPARALPPRPQHPRHGPRALHLPRDRARARQRHLGEQRARKGLDVPGPPADPRARCRAGAPALRRPVVARAAVAAARAAIRRQRAGATLPNSASGSGRRRKTSIAACVCSQVAPAAARCPQSSFRCDADGSIVLDVLRETDRHQPVEGGPRNSAGAAGARASSRSPSSRAAPPVDVARRRVERDRPRGVKYARRNSSTPARTSRRRPRG